MMRTLATFLLASIGLPGLASSAETWLELKTPGFTVISNSGERTARKTAHEFEQVRAAYGKVWPWARHTQGTPVVVLALKNEDTFRRWAPGYFEGKGDFHWVSGSAFGADRRFLLLRTDARPADQEVTPNYNLYRSYVGMLLSSGLRRRLPSWLWNGLGEVLGNTTVKDDEILLGRPVPWQFRRFAENPRMPLRRILVAENDPSMSSDSETRAQYDAQTCILVHYLLFGDRGVHAAKLARFQDLWQGGTAHDEALAAAFGDLDALEGALPSYATKKILSYAVLKAETEAGGVLSTRVLAPVEVLGQQAAVHVAMDRREDAAKAVLAARSLDPLSPVSYEAEGLLRDREGDEAAALEAYSRAVELGSTSRHSHYRAAQLAWKPQVDAPSLLAIQKRLERALELDEADADAHSFLARVLEQQGKTQEARVAAERATVLEPGRSDHRVALGWVLLSLGRGDEAREAGRLGLQLAGNAGERAEAQSLLTSLEERLRYERMKAEVDARNACQGGDSAACARIVPDLERACADRDTAACAYLGWLHLHGGGVVRDEAKGAGFFQQACDAGDKKSCVEGAWVLARAGAGASSNKAALASLEALCADGFLPACTRLALVHAAKPGATARTRAKSLLARACSGGDAEACRIANELR